MKTIYFVRHGSTYGVENEIYQSFNTPLSETGRQQAIKSAQYFKDIQPDAIIASTMTRASETAEIIKNIAKLNATIQYTDLYHEVHRPSEVREKSKFDPEVVEIIRKTRENFTNKDWKYSDEENFFDLKNRALEALQYTTSQDGDVLLVTTHATFLKIVLAVIVFGNDLTPDTLSRFKDIFWVENTSISKVTFKDSRWRVISWNDHGHLLDKLE